MYNETLKNRVFIEEDIYKFDKAGFAIDVITTIKTLLHLSIDIHIQVLRNVVIKNGLLLLRLLIHLIEYYLLSIIFTSKTYCTN